MQIDEAISRSLLAALTPLGLEAALAAAERLEVDRDAALAHWRHAVERAIYEEQRISPTTSAASFVSNV
jgi:hypothetical protein